MKIESSIRQLPLIAFILIEVLFITLVTHMSFDLFAFELKSAAYDSLAISFLRGSAEVSLRAIADEGQRVNGHTYMYFGFFPALIRIPLHFLFPSLIGYWGRLSCLSAAMLAVYFFSRISKLLLESRAEILGIRNAEIIHWTLCLGFACASPIIYLISCAYIYHEASLWGLAGSLCGLWGLIEISSAACPARRLPFLRLSLGGGIALCSRGTFGVPFVLLLCFYSAMFIYRFLRNTFVSPSLKNVEKAILRFDLIVILLPAIFFIAFQCWYDYARYGNILDVGISRTTKGHSYLQVVIDSGPENILPRIYSALSNYFAAPWHYIDTVFPYIHLRTPTFAAESIYAEYKEWNISLILVLPWLLLLSAAGIFALVKRALWVDLLHICIFAPQCYIVLTFYFITQRYVADFLPLLIFLASFSIHLIVSPFPLRRVVLIRRILIILVAFSCVTNLVSTISWNLMQNWAISPQDRVLIHALTGVAKPKLGVPSEYRSSYYPDGPPL